MLGLLWSRAVRKRRRPGRPTYQQTEFFLSRAIHNGTVLEDMTSGVMPKWRRPSMPLKVPEAEAERIADTESPAKRANIHQSAEVKNWCLDLGGD